MRRPRYRATSGWRYWLAARVFHRSLWRPEGHALSLGVAIGLAVAMLPPVPIQMLCAALLAVLLRGNIPIATAGVWVSNPATWLPILNFQRELGRRLLPPGDGGLDTGLGVGFESLRSLTLGVVLSAMVLAVAGYAIMALLWRIFWHRRGVASAEVGEPPAPPLP